MQAAGGVMGAVGGLFANQKEGGKNTGNIFQSNNIDPEVLRQKAISGFGDQQANLDNTSQVQNNGIQGQLYGQGGLLSQTLGQEQDLANNGFNLTDTDKTAYGEAAGSIARQFGQNDQSLSQALSDRGLGSSGVAGQQFSNSLGNKNEQLAGLQTQIAQNRMQMNQQRLSQTQNFLSQLGQGAQTAMNSQFSQNLSRSQNAQAEGQQASNYLSKTQAQSDEALQQEQQTAHAGSLSNAFNGGLAGMAAMGQSGKSGASGMSMFAGGGAGGGGMA